MNERRTFSWAIVVAVTVALFAFGPTATALGPGAVVRTEEPPPSTTAPAAPETSQPATTEPGGPEPGDESSDESDYTTVTIVGVLAVGLLIALAGWWMVSRNDDDDATHPRPPNPDEPLPGQDLL
jgi:hypothetical protein